MAESVSHFTLLYDGDCPLCTQAARWVSMRTLPSRIDVLPCRDPQRPLRFPQVTEADCLAAVRLVASDGAVYAGADALAIVLRHTKRYGWLGRLLQLPGIRRLVPFAYQIAARNRYGLSRILGSRFLPLGACLPDGECGGASGAASRHSHAEEQRERK